MASFMGFLKYVKGICICLTVEGAVEFMYLQLRCVCSSFAKVTWAFMSICQIRNYLHEWDRTRDLHQHLILNLLLEPLDHSAS